MKNFIGAIGIATAALFVPAAHGPLESIAVAQSSNAGPSVSRVIRLFEKRVAQIKETRSLDDQERLEKEMQDTKTLMSEQLKLIKRDGTDATRARIWDIQSAIEHIDGYSNDAINYVWPKGIGMSIVSLRNWCMDKEAEAELAGFAKLIEQIRLKVEAAKKRTTPPSKDEMTAKEWQEYYQESLKEYKEALEYKAPPCKGKENVGASDTGSETVTLPPLSVPPPETLEATSETDFGADKLKAISETSAWLLGDWVYKAWNGGTTNSVLRFRLESNGSISGYLVSVTEQMADKGFQPGMQLLRGITDTSYTIRKPGNTWSHSAMVAETYSPKDPRREPGQIYGQAGWSKSGVIFINKSTGELGGSTGFQNNRLNWHRGTLVRPNLSSLERLNEQLFSQIERAGTRTQRLEQLRQIVGQLTLEGRNSREAREAASLLRLLLEREELGLSDQSETRTIIDAILSGNSDAELRQLLQGLARQITAQTAHLAHPIAGNDYDGKIAANMFLVGINGSKIREGIGEEGDFRDRSNKSRLAQDLSTLREIAASAGNSKDGTGQNLMDGLRDLRSIAALDATASPVLEVPAQISAAILQQNATGFGHASNALKEIARAIEGDESAIGRAIGHTKRLEQVVSGPGYYKAIKDSITDRIASNVPFVRTIVDWFE